MSTNWFAILRLPNNNSALTGAFMAGLLSGCAIPYSFSELPKEHLIELRFPQNLSTVKDEVLVMVQSKRSWGFSSSLNRDLPDIVHEPIFIPGEALNSLNQTLKLESASGLALILPAGYEAAIIGVGSTEQLDRICVITQDGRNITVFPNDDEQPEPSETTTSANRRDAIVSALRDNMKSPFEKVDGPCGISGEVNWPKKMRTRTIDFLAKIPSKYTSDENVPLALILSRGKTAANTAGPEAGGMLLTSTSVHGQSYVESPTYFTTTDFKVLKEALAASNAMQIIPMLPRYISGRNAPEYISLDLLLAANSDGRVLWWSNEEKVWRGLYENPFDKEWRDSTMVALSRLPKEDQYQATAFLDRAHIPNRTHTPERIKAKLKVVAEDAGTAGSKALLLSIVFSAQDIVVKHFFLQSSDISSAATSIKLLSVGELMRLLPQLNSREAYAIDNLKSGYICLISEDGRIIELEQKNAAVWSKPKYSRVTTTWRNEAISAVLRNGGYQGKFVCSLEKTSDWPDELRDKVTSFIKKIAQENGTTKH